MNPSEKLNALSRRRKIMLLTPVLPSELIFVVNDGLGDISDALFVAEIEKDTGDVDAYTDHCTDIERIQPFVNPFLVKILKSDFIVFSP